MVLSVHEDFLNRKNTRNEENTDSILYNCAGYALKTYSWWRPFFGDAPSGYEQIYELADEGYSMLQIDPVAVALDRKGRLGNDEGKPISEIPVSASDFVLEIIHAISPEKELLQ